MLQQPVQRCRNVPVGVVALLRHSMHPPASDTTDVAETLYESSELATGFGAGRASADVWRS
jgi:hypothetical protein